ncbi:MAG TPA: class I SAM-dependent methyltransferase [Gemmatimonadaceae bacterium]|nr:class I SAM-dependent methyltransferase [Gemmatimonadaceae bacterium]
MGSPQPRTPEYFARMRALEAQSWWNAGMRDVAARLLDLAALDDECTVLDVGCGSGQTLAWVRQTHPGWAALGLDISEDALSDARNEHIDLVLASATNIPLARASADLVIALDVLHHLPVDGGDVAALGEIMRVLKPGGYLLFRTNAQSFPRKADDVTSSYRKYDPSDLRQKLVAAGFEIVRMGRVNAVLGLAEIPRELRARRRRDSGILAPEPTAPGRADSLKRAWLNLEGRAVLAGWRLPLGRSIVGLCRA